jgi:SAM-dependent methyltransferase
MTWQKRDRPPGANRAPVRKPDTSWEKSAGWYDGIIGAQGSEIYQRIVIPGALRLLNPLAGESALDLGCGQGVFARALAAKGCEVTGLDAAPSLIRKARDYPSREPIHYLARDAAHLHGLGPFDAASAILSLQNMPHPDKVCAAANAALQPGGRMLWVMNHPCFRIPRQTSWGWDEEKKIQYRRLDAYASPLNIPILMHPGQSKSESTVSFHHSLTDLMGFGFRASFTLAGLEEWVSEKQSEPGPRARAENRARREFPLFLALLWRKGS